MLYEVITPGQQRRDRARQHAAQDVAGGLDRGDQHEPQFRVQRDQARGRRNVHARMGPHREPVVGQRPAWPVRPDELSYNFV